MTSAALPITITTFIATNSERDCDSCIVCHDAFKNDDKIVSHKLSSSTGLSCDGHFTHFECMRKWMSNQMLKRFDLICPAGCHAKLDIKPLNLDKAPVESRLEKIGRILHPLASFSIAYLAFSLATTFSISTCFHNLKSMPDSPKVSEVVAIRALMGFIGAVTYSKYLRSDPRRVPFQAAIICIAACFAFGILRLAPENDFTRTSWLTGIIVAGIFTHSLVRTIREIL